MDRSVVDIAAIDESTWDRTIADNLTGVWLCSKAVLPTMIAQKSGAIINLAPNLQPFVDLLRLVHPAQFDERLDEGTEQVVGDLKQLMHANMSEEIDRFVSALEAEALLPEDF